MTAHVASGTARKRHTETVRGPELVASFERLAKDIAVLSLDCFDTLLFRRTERPVDVFFDLAQTPPFAALGFAAKTRIESESRARSLARLRRGSTEVKLPEVYRTAFPELTDDEVAALAAAELSAEKAACYAFSPTVELVRAAKARGLSVIVVSDTYLAETELRALLSATLPPDVYAAIGRVFCSSEFGRSKAGGLFEDVKRALGRKAASMLHVGDHEISDLEASHRAGMSSLRLLHHEPAVEQLLRAQSIAAALVAPDIRESRGLPSPFTGLYAAQKDLAKPETLLGYAGAGPILYAFARFLVEELDELERSGARPKALFLMRDAHLPHLVADDVAGRALGTDVALSRSVAYAASFRSKDDIERYLARSAGSARIDAMARQLGLDGALAGRLIRECERSDTPGLEFARRVRDASVTSVVLERSAAFRRRLLRYLEKRVGMKRGDTLVLVDLGYEGTVQRELGPVLEAELGVTVTGRYLLASRVPGWEKTRKGLFDPGSCDDRVLA
ncbi:MAG TPA: HAD family hydrolase, partial [Polyangiaceae bacterium]